MNQISASHGTEAGYQRGCRCQSCRDANAIASRAKRERRKLAAAGMLDPPPAHLRRRAAPDSAQQTQTAQPRQQAAAGHANASTAGRLLSRPSRQAQRPVEPRAARVVVRPRRSSDAPAAAKPVAALTAARQPLELAAAPAAPPLPCHVRGCREPGTRELDAYPPVTALILAEQLAEGRDSLPTRRCDRHAAELTTRWPAGTWHEYGTITRPAT